MRMLQNKYKVEIKKVTKFIMMLLLFYVNYWGFLIELSFFFNKEQREVKQL